MVVISKPDKDENSTNNAEEQTWEHPENPEKASDKRDEEQLQRQAKEALRRKENLTDENQQDK